MKNKIKKGARNFYESVLTKIPVRPFQFAPVCVVFLFLFSAAVQAQDLPDEIRGYKVSSAKVAVKLKGEKTQTKDKSEVYVNVADPQMTSVSPMGVTFEISADIEPLEQSGKVDFLTFKDFRVNGMAVDLEEYQNPFELKKNQIIILPKPIKVFVNSGQSLLGAISEIGASKEEWTVTGRIFVFGKFKKFGMNFKRVVPVDVNIRIKNPVKNSNGIFRN